MLFGKTDFRVKTRPAQAVFLRGRAEDGTATESELAEAQPARNSNPLYHEAFHQLMAEKSPSPGYVRCGVERLDTRMLRRPSPSSVV
ncbi:hypothetical protein CEP53_000115 [Fusarium sp. AF-6]|nr:hypothetical protein CEP53_000115 [Fusarium sp. AF-6]